MQDFGKTTYPEQPVGLVTENMLLHLFLFDTSACVVMNCYIASMGYKFQHLYPVTIFPEIWSCRFGKCCQKDKWPSLLLMARGFDLGNMW